MAEILYDTKYNYPDNLDTFGEYINPNNGETDWIDPTIFCSSKIIIPKDRISIIGNNNIQTIEYNLNYEKGFHYVEFYASIKYESVIYKIDPLLIDLKAICDESAQLVYSEKNFRDSKMIKDLKEIAKQKLFIELFKKNIIFGNFNFKNIGFIIIDNKKAVSIDEIKCKYNIKENICTITLDKCIGNIDLTNIDIFSVEFYIGDYKLQIDNIQNVKCTNDSRIKTYELIANKIKVIKVTDICAATEYLDEDDFIQKRSSLLDNLFDDNEDDRFDDDFF